jgi:hypothetical protein
VSFGDRIGLTTFPYSIGFLADQKALRVRHSRRGSNTSSASKSGERRRRRAIAAATLVFGTAGGEG